MKQILKFLLAILISATAFTACDKKDTLLLYPNGTAVTLSSSVTNITPTAADSSKKLINFSWTDPKYAQDSSQYKYVLEIDTAGRKFAQSIKISMNGRRDTAFTGSQFNNILAALGFKIGAAVTLDTRITSSYANNNEQYISNMVTITATPYSFPFAVTLAPASPLILTIANAANTALTFNWSATKYGSYAVTYAVQADVAGGTFANPQVFNFNNALTGNITVSALNTAALNLGAVAGASTDMQYRIVATIASNPVNKVYSNIITNKITPYLPFYYLWVPGDYQGWNPGAPAPVLGATTPNINDYEGYVNVPSGGSYEFKINDAPDWNHTSYGSGGAGILSTSGGNLKWPGGGGYYLVKANPVSLTWSATKTTWSIIGSATPGGWGGDTPMTYDAVNKVWVINSVTLTGGNELKLRANNDWGINLGGSPGNLNYGGSNIPIATTGTYKVTLNLNTPLKYTLTIQ